MAERNMAELTPVDAPALTVVFNHQALPGLQRGQPEIAADSRLYKILAKYGASLQPIFASTLAAPAAYVPVLAGAASHAELSLFYHVEAVTDQLNSMAKELLSCPEVDGAYVKPPGVPPLAFEMPAAAVSGPSPAGPSSTLSLMAKQGHLNAAPDGLDAQWAWTIPGGRGTGVRLVDCEWGWRHTHEDLLASQSGVVLGTPSSHADPSLINHGTAVVGIVSGDSNPYGITGIAPAATVESSSFHQGWIAVDTAAVIVAAADALRQGDIILLEIHRPGPASPTGDSQQHGYLPIEWWPDDFAAIRYATSKGILVIEPAGNGSQNLDDALYDTPPPGFPRTWTNPFRLGNPQCGAILVGAGTTPRCSRLPFSNYGARLDAQGWGDRVATTGFGDLQGGGNADRWYTAAFNGTSSAAACVAGAVAAVQGVSRTRGRRPLTGAEAKRLLRLSGSPQRAALGGGRPAAQRIGNRPDLRALIPAAAGLACRSGDFDGDGRAEVLVTSPTGIAFLKRRRDGALGASVVARNGARFGGWLLNTADSAFGPVADFDGDGVVESLVTSPWGIAILKLDGSDTVSTQMVQPNGTYFGNWFLNTIDTCFGPAGDFDGDGCAEVLVTSPWHLGVLKQAGSTMAPVMMAPNGTMFGQWRLDTTTDEFGPVGNFSGTTGRTEIFISSVWGIGFLQLSGTTFAALYLAPNGTKIGPWRLDTDTMRFGPVGDFDGDGYDEIMAISPSGIAILKLLPSRLTVLMCEENGSRLGTDGWFLDTAENHFGPARDYDNDGKAEILVTSPWGVTILKLVGNTMTPIVMQANGTYLTGGWFLDTSDIWLGTAADYDESGKVGILVSSPRGVGIFLYASGSLTCLTGAANGTDMGGWNLDTLTDNFGHGT